MTRTEVLDRYCKEAGHVAGDRFVLEELLDEVDGLICKKILENYEGFDGNVQWGDPNRQMLAEKPFDRLYHHWLNAQVALRHEESARYENAYILFNQAMDDFAGFYHRNHMPKSHGTWKF